MPSRLHAVYARVVPRVRKAEEMGGPEPHERARVERWHLTLDRTFPIRAVPGFHRRFSLVREELVTRQPASRRTSSRRATGRLAVLGARCSTCTAAVTWRRSTRSRFATSRGWRPPLGARVVMPDYPLAPEHTWRDSHDAVVELAARWASEPGGIALVGDSSGGGFALAVAISLRDRGRAQATHVVFHSPWVDLTTSTPETDAFDEVDPWLFVGKLRAYALWWAGSPDDLGRPEVSPALADLAGLPPGLMFCGTRDLLRAGLSAAGPSCRRGGVAAHLRRTARPHPRLLRAAVPPGGPAGIPADRGLPGWTELVVTVEVLTFDDLDATTAYDVWRLRQQVFVVEQGSPYPDLDGRDSEPATRHLLLRVEGVLVGYARVLDDGGWARIGRVVVAKDARGQGFAGLLVRAALDAIGDREVRLDAQTGLVEWYASYGFEASGPEFDDDGVFHRPMSRPAAPTLVEGRQARHETP